MHALTFSMLGLSMKLLLGLIIVQTCFAAPLDAGVQFEKRDDSLPLLKLPYGTWRASKHDPNGDVWFTLPHTSGKCDLIMTQ